MKRLGAGLLMTLLTFPSMAQKATDQNTLLWKISGKGLKAPSYLFGTIHMLCKDDATLSDSLKRVIRQSDEVYFEVDLDNMIEMLSVISKMKMRGDTTLQDLLSEADYEKVKTYFESKGSVLPFAMLETYKPILAASMLQGKPTACETTAMMEQVIMQEASSHSKKIRGLETMGYQAEILDGIPYKLQAQQLVEYVDAAVKGEGESKELSEMMQAYREQDLQKLEQMMLKDEAGIAAYAELLLYGRNRNWVEKLKDILPQKSVLIAVGAGHLPGTQGVIALLRKAGYTVSPVENKVNTSREI